MSGIIRTFVGVTIAAALAACATRSPEEVATALKDATAVAIQSSDSTAIEIVSSQQQSSKWVWKAKAAGRIYDCDADDMMRLPQCRATS
jgi:hypothetical protein